MLIAIVIAVVEVAFAFVCFVVTVFVCFVVTAFCLFCCYCFCLFCFVVTVIVFCCFAVVNTIESSIFLFGFIDLQDQTHLEQGQKRQQE